MEGTVIGTYRVLSKLGEGGMGAVYIGEHTLLGRRAAIKVLLPELSSHKEIVQRFFNEAKAVTQISDPGIVQVFDFGHHVDGSAFIIMELLDGEPMDKRLERISRFQPLDCLRLMRLLCTSLASAHAKGIVHRDLKPENIFLVGDPAVTGGERAKILDFGIAKLTADEPNKMKTRTGMVMGTPVYMSPEQCRGAGDVDARSDIYSLGCVMMTMLTGRPPFEAQASGELIVAHLCEAPPLASSRLPGLPELFDQILQRCLAKTPSDRYASMTELAKTLGVAEQMILQTSTPALTADLASYVASGLTPPPGMRTPTPLPAQASTVLLKMPTTLNGAAGQAVAATPRSSRRLGLVAAAIGVVAAGGIAVFLATRPHDSAAPIAETPASAPLVLPIDAGVARVESPDAAVAVTTTTPVDAAVVASPPPPPASEIDAGVATKTTHTSRPKHTTSGGTNHATDNTGSDSHHGIDRGD
jgi:serine/threonine-protein kinase